MNKLYFVAALCCLMSPVLLSAQCPTSLYFPDQSLVDSFPIKYPNCTVLDGDVILYDIEDATPLAQVERINGSLTFDYFIGDTLDAFPNLKYVAGSVKIETGEVKTIRGFGSIDTILKHLVIYDMPQATSIQGFQQLKSIGSMLDIKLNRKIESIPEFPNLNFVQDISITDNDSLKNITGFEQLTQLKSCVINRHKSLGAVNAFNNLTQVDSLFLLSQAPKLTSFNGLSNLNKVPVLGLTYLPKMKTISDFNHLAELDYALFFDFDSLTHFPTFGQLQKAKEIRIGQVNNIDSLNSFPVLDSVGGLGVGYASKLRHSHFPQLKTISVLDVDNVQQCRLQFPELIFLDTFSLALTNPTYDSVFLDVPLLTKIPGLLYLGLRNAQTSLYGLSQIDTIGSFFIDVVFNGPKQTLGGYTNLKRINKDLYIESNGLSLDLQLPALKSVGNEINFSQFHADSLHLFIPALDSTNSLVLNNNPTIKVLEITNQLKHMTGDIQFRNNQLLTQIPAFNHLKRCNSLQIVDNPQLNNLPVLLPAVDSIYGDVLMDENPILDNLEGLNEVLYVGGGFSCTVSNSLKNMAVLEKANTIKKGILINYVNELTTLTGLENVQNINPDANIEIGYAPKLTSIPAFNQVKHLNDLEIYQCGQLTSISGFNSLDSLYGSLDINNNASLTTLQGFGPLQYVDKNLRIQLNNSLNSVTGFENVHYLGGDCKLVASPITTMSPGFTALKNIGGSFILQLTEIGNWSFLPVIEQIKGGVRISTNPNLTDLSGLKRIQYTDGNFEVFSNMGLTNLSGLDSLQRVGGTFDIAGNTGITSLSGLNRLDSVGGDLSIWYNAVLADISQLKRVKSAEYLFLYDNFALPNLNGLDSLTTVRGRADIFQNANLVNLTGLNRLRSVGSVLSIVENEKMTSLEGLNGLKTVGDLEIWGNNQLQDMSSLNGMDTISGALSILINPLLSFCSVKPVCAHLEAGNPADISGNAIGCASSTQILNLCISGSTEQWVNTVACFPNPVLHTLRISAPAEGAFYRYELFSMTGTLVASTDAKTVTEIDMRHLPEGVYQLRGLSEHGMVQRLIVKQ
jgi:hypothetical protein